MRALTLRPFAAALLAACALSTPARAGHSIWDASGFNDNRSTFSQLPYEHVDPMTGNLLLTFTDLELPGNAGFNLRIQRTYNSKAMHADYENLGFTPGEDSWSGAGWILHLGRVFQVLNPDPTVYPIIEMPDGSRHETVPHLRPPASCVGQCYVTKEHWVFEKSTRVLRMPNGVVYTFGQHAQRNTVPGGAAHYATLIQDPFGNQITISYRTAPSDGINTITQNLQGGQTRLITFTTNTQFEYLTGMTYGSSTWTYTQVLPSGQAWSSHRWLTAVTAPEGLVWSFTQDPASGEITRVTTPLGGQINYTYADRLFRLGITSFDGDTWSRAVATRITGGRDIPAGTWTYLQSTGTNNNQTVITSPCSTTTYTFLGVGSLSGSEPPWRVGLQDSVVTTDSSGLLETSTTQWIASDPISNAPTAIGPRIDPQTVVPLVQSQSTTRGGITYTTTHSYRPDGTFQTFNDYGRPETTIEAGQLSRKTTREFQYGFSGYIVDKVGAETVQSLAPGTTIPVGTAFRTTYTYASTTGFLTSRDVYGVVATRTPDAKGNVATVTDGVGNTTTFTHDWGVPKTVRTATYGTDLITRVVNSNGTIASETRRGFTTSFLYDNLFRPTRVTPPIGNMSTTTYVMQSGVLMRTEVTRGALMLRSNLDGFGRASSTERVAAGVITVFTDTNYDVCDRKTYESYPYTNLNIGSTFVYDGLGRVLQTQNPPAQAGGAISTVNYDYSANQVTITDEEGRPTVQTWSAYGSPGSSVLASVLEANSQTTSYEYDVLGSLTRVDAPVGADRTWTYNSKGQLEQEQQPENDGNVTYTYYDNGNLRTRTDGMGTATFAYDAMSRLMFVDRPGTAYDTTIQYDQSDNRTAVSNSHVQTALGPYDGANRLPTRTDTVGGQSFTTSYTYDVNDNLKTITYPLGTTRKVDYDYDNANQITQVDNAAPTPAVYANAFSYHPSGALASYLAGNGLTHNLTYDQRYRVSTLNAGGLLQLGYSYDRVGNVMGITDARPGMNQTFGYDTLDRLNVASGPWGSGTFDYDAIGNRTIKQIGSAVTNYAYPTKNRLANSSGSEPNTYTYDWNGNTKTSNGATFSYTPENQVEVATVSGAATTYRYDSDNLRKLKLETDGTLRYYVHGPGNQILTEFKKAPGASVEVVRDYVYAGTRLIAALKPPVLTAPEVMSFIAVVAPNPTPVPQSLAVATANDTGVAWTASEATSWLSIAPASGTTPGNVTVSVNHAGLTAGTYSATITVTAPNAVGSPRTVAVTLHVLQTAALTVAPTSLRFSMVEGRANPGPQAVTVLYPYTSVSWRTTVSAPWLQVTPATGTTPAALTVSVNGTGLTAGTYQATVGVIADGVAGSPKSIVVQLVVEPPAGATCAPDAWYCEPFDGLTRGSINGQGGWFANDAVAFGQVDSDPRGVGNAFILDPPAGEVSNDQVNVPDHAIDRTEISMHVRLGDLPQDQKQVGKLEFYTSGNAWGKTGRTFGAIRMAGGIIYVQYGPNIYKRIVDNAESNRFYDVKVRYRNGRIDAIVDGTPRFSTTNPVSGTQPIQAFVATGWDLPGSAWIDLLQARPLAATQQPELYVDPLILNFSGVQTASLDAPAPNTRMASAADPVAPPSQDKLGALPMVFEPNVGQGPDDAKFLARGAGYAVWLTSEGPDIHAGTDSVALRLKGARSSEPKAEQPLLGKSNYFMGGDRSKWRTGVRHFGRVRYEEVYDRIDAVFYGNQRRLEYDLELRPGADPDVVRMGFDGATAVRIDDGGDLVISTATGEMRQHAPVAYQMGPAGREPVKVAYAVADDRSVSLQVSDYDRQRSLVIDPVLTYSTLVGGAGADQANAIAVDGQGYVYIAGTTLSDDFPVNTFIQSIRGGGDDAFVTKLSRDGTNVIYSTYLGGTGTDRALALTVDDAGSVYVVGSTWGGGQFPVVNALMPTQGPFVSGGFLAHLDAEGSQLEFSTYFSSTGGSVTPTAVQLNGGHLYVAGDTAGGASVIAGHGVSKVNRDNFFWNQSPFVARLPLDGHEVFAVVVLNGGGGYDNTVRLGFDGAGSVYLAAAYGNTPLSFADRVSNPVPLSPNGWLGGIYNNGGFHITKLGPLSSDPAVFTPVIYSALAGGGGADHLQSLVVDAEGYAYVAGWTQSGFGGNAPFPTTTGALSTTFGGGIADGFLLKLNPQGTAPVYSTYLSSPGNDFMRALGVDATGRAAVAGSADPNGYPAAACVSKQTFGSLGATSATVLVVDPTGSAYEYCGFIGSSAIAWGVAFDATGAIFAAGSSTGAFYTTPGAFQSTANGGNAFVTKFSNVGAPGGAGIFQFSSATYSGSESGSCVSITVTRTGSTTGYASVTYSTSDGTAGALDYISVSDTILFEPGETSKTFSVPIQDDAMVEPTETINLTLSSPTDGAGLGTQKTAVLSILDNDQDLGLSKTFVVRDRFLGAGPSWTATIQNAPWLIVTPMSGIGPSTATATASTSGLAPGTYNGTVTITSPPGTLASPQVIQVRLVVTAP